MISLPKNVKSSWCLGDSEKGKVGGKMDRLPKLPLHLIAIFHGTQGSKLQTEISALSAAIFPSSFF